MVSGPMSLKIIVHEASTRRSLWLVASSPLPSKIVLDRTVMIIAENDEVGLLQTPLVARR
jgi:hypothetical protein